MERQKGKEKKKEKKKEQAMASGTSLRAETDLPLTERKKDKIWSVCAGMSISMLRPLGQRFIIRNKCQLLLN